MADVLQFEQGKAKALGGKIPAHLREFIDSVIVPCLVREFVEQNDLASRNCCVADSATKENFDCEVPA